MPLKIFHNRGQQCIQTPRLWFIGTSVSPTFLKHPFKPLYIATFSFTCGWEYIFFLFICFLLCDKVFFKFAVIKIFKGIGILQLSLLPKESKSIIPNLKINSVPIARVTEFSFLCVTIDDNLNWDAPTPKITNKITRTPGTMNRLKHFLPLTVMRILYTALILPHL